MDMILIAVLAAVVGGIATWVVTRASRGAATAAVDVQLAAQREQLTAASAAADVLRAERDRATAALRTETERRATAEAGAARAAALDANIARLNVDLATHKASLAAGEARLAAEQQAARQNLALLEEARAKLSEAFKALSSDALQRNNQAFLQLAQATLEKFQQGAAGDLEARQKAIVELTQPIRERLEKFDGKLDELEKARHGAYRALSQQVDDLLKVHLPQLQRDTAGLVKALRQPQARGRWGEVQLRRVVEMAGMLEHCDFDEQVSQTREDGGRLRPDLIVYLPGGRRVVVDAKAPVDAYLEAVEAQDEGARAQALVRHARQVREHIAALGKKAYFDQFDPTPEFVVLFVPGEAFFSAALAQDVSIIEYGAESRVIPASPTTLIALLKAVAYGWRQEAVAQNAQEVANLGKELHERISTLAGHWIRLGERLDKALEAYNSATATLESRVLVSTRRFAELGAAAADAKIDTPLPIERLARKPQAAELATNGDVRAIAGGGEQT